MNREQEVRKIIWNVNIISAGHTAEIMLEPDAALPLVFWERVWMPGI